jgi:hypothetical protein|tara:strand:+ start:38411 stop:38764 length:354 start_codon:yes stop_codon:yes gene_type:complete
MKTILLDTDFLLQSLRWKIDLETELRRILDFSFTLCILDKTLEELEGKKDEQLAKTYITRLEILPTKKDKPVDDLLFTYEPKEDLIVATQDKELKEKLKKRNIPLITIRNKSHLELV